MSSAPIIPARPKEAEDRRVQPRGKLGGLAYVKCGPDNGGILMDVSEGGIRFQGIGTVTDGEVMRVRFVLPGMGSAIEADAQLVWSNESKKGGGLRFIDLDANSREQIRKWLIQNGTGVPAKEETPAASVVVPAAASSTVPAVVAAAVPSVVPEGAAEAPDISLAAPAETSGKPLVVKTPYSDGLRRIHSVPPAAPASTAPSAMTAAPATPAAATAPTISPANDSQAVTPPTHAEDFGEPALASEAKRRVVLSGISERDTRKASYLLVAVIGCAVLLAAALGFRWRGAIAGLFQGNAGGAVAGQSAQGAPQDFQVEVVDLNNKRFVLENAAPASTAPAPAQGALPVAPLASPRSAPAAPSQASIASQNKALQKLVLQAPRVVKRPASPADRQDAPVADSLAPVVPSLDPRFAPDQASPAPPRPGQSAGAPAVQSGIQAAVLIKSVQPFYPPVARQLHIQGIVQVHASIDRDGVPHELKLLSGDPRLAGPALDAVRQWRYKPAMLDGQAVESETTIQLEFRFQNN